MESRRFPDRAEAGRLLADRLRHYARRDDVIVLALLRTRPMRKPASRS
jgi:predicted phosphoribosyltransferase